MNTGATTTVKSIVAAFELARERREMERRRQRVDELFSTTSVGSATTAPAPFASLSSSASSTTPSASTPTAPTSIDNTSLTSTTTTIEPLQALHERCSTPSRSHDERALAPVTTVPAPSSTSPLKASALVAAPAVAAAEEEVFTTTPAKCSTLCLSRDSKLRYFTICTPMIEVTVPCLASKVYDAQKVFERPIDQYLVVLWPTFNGCLDFVLSRQLWPPPMQLEFLGSICWVDCSTIGCVFDRGKLGEKAKSITLQVRGVYGKNLITASTQLTHTNMGYGSVSKSRVVVLHVNPVEGTQLFLCCQTSTQFKPPWVSCCCSVYGVLWHISIQFQQQRAVSAMESLHGYFIYAGYGQLIIQGNPSAIQCWKHGFTLLDTNKGYSFEFSQIRYITNAIIALSGGVLFEMAVAVHGDQTSQDNAMLYLPPAILVDKGKRLPILHFDQLSIPPKPPWSLLCLEDDSYHSNIATPLLPWTHLLVLIDSVQLRPTPWPSFDFPTIVQLQKGPSISWHIIQFVTLCHDDSRLFHFVTESFLAAVNLLNSLLVVCVNATTSGGCQMNTQVQVPWPSFWEYATATDCKDLISLACILYASAVQLFWCSQMEIQYKTSWVSLCGSESGVICQQLVVCLFQSYQYEGSWLSFTIICWLCWFRDLFTIITSLQLLWKCNTSGGKSVLFSGSVCHAITLSWSPGLRTYLKLFIVHIVWWVYKQSLKNGMAWFPNYRHVAHQLMHIIVHIVHTASIISEQLSLEHDNMVFMLNHVGTRLCHYYWLIQIQFRCTIVRYKATNDNCSVTHMSVTSFEAIQLEGFLYFAYPSTNSEQKLSEHFSMQAAQSSSTGIHSAISVCWDVIQCMPFLIQLLQQISNGLLARMVVSHQGSSWDPDGDQYK
ncbi:unnamed protein product [Urochloa decumbens]|uniref:Uncharacterized protein n=1 Tax=Urochloa decumbens TaxID=240449 RepID=A0ABC8W2D3_9POAL